MSKHTAHQSRAVKIRHARDADLPVIVALDARVTKVHKEEYWKDLFARLVVRKERCAILLAEIESRVVGFIIGEIRAWEFGEPPCGWIIGLNIEPDFREQRIASTLFEHLTSYFRERGLSKVRTLTRRDDNLPMSFFRSQGLTAGPFVELERDIDE